MFPIYWSRSCPLWYFNNSAYRACLGFLHRRIHYPSPKCSRSCRFTWRVTENPEVAPSGASAGPWRRPETDHWRIAHPAPESRQTPLSSMGRRLLVPIDRVADLYLKVRGFSLRWAEEPRTYTTCLLLALRGSHSPISLSAGTEGRVKEFNRGLSRFRAAIPAGPALGLRRLSVASRLVFN